MSLGPSSLIQQYCQDPNGRLQIAGIRLGPAGGGTTTNCSSSNDALNLAFSYGSAGYNNGSLTSETLLPLNATQNFTYDAYNRLLQASEGTAWSQSYKYDLDGNANASLGNRYVSAYSGIVPLSFTPTANTNFNSSNQLTIQGSTYYSAGNLKTIGAYSFTYDAENRQVSATTGSATTNYSYDGEGHRVQKVSGGVTTVYAYDAKGEVAAEYSTSPPTQTETQYLTANHLGSTRLVSSAAGTALGYHDYLPFGEEILPGIDGRGSLYGPSDGDGLTQKFTAKERDAETAGSAMQALDYFGARYFSGTQGRFTNPDEPLADQDPANPQSWNLYGYVRNSPLANIDPTGQDCVTTSNQTSTSVSVAVAAGGTESGCTQSGGAWVAGKVDMSSLTYNGSSIGYSYTPYDTNSLTGGGTIPLGSGPSDALSPSAQEFYNQMSARTESSNHMIAEFGMAQLGFAGAYVGTYAGPAILGTLTAAGGEAGYLKFGSKAFELVRDFQGRIHGDLPEFVPKDATRDELELAAEELKQSLEVRQQTMQQLGELGNHGLRIAQEQRLLHQIEQRLGKR